MQTVVYNTPLYHLSDNNNNYYFCPYYIQCILLLNLYRITIILLLFSSRMSEGVYMTLF